MSEVKIGNLVKKFDWEVVCGDKQSLSRPIVLADTNRPGLELAGYFTDSQSKRLVVLGDKEMGYIEEEMDEVSQRRSFEFLTNEKTPGIIITHGHRCPEILKEIAIRKQFPVFCTKTKTTQAIVSITNYLDEQLAPCEVVHGELMRIFGVGVMITGSSGMGKSEIALELIKRGHQLVADDRIDCYCIHDQLVGKTPHMLEGFMELRGVGIINVVRMFGIASFATSTQIQFQIALEPFDDTQEYDRVGIEEKEYTEILGVKILKLRIPISMGRPMSTIIESAVTNFLLLQKGLDSAKEFEERVLEEISKNKGED